MVLKTKREVLTSVVKTIYDVVCISVSKPNTEKVGLDRESYHVNKAKFNRNGIANYRKVFAYTFKESYPRWSTGPNKGALLNRRDTYISALTWLSDFFKMGIVPDTLIKHREAEPNVWGVKIYDCYMYLFGDYLFVGNGTGEDEDIDCEEIRDDLSDVIKERLFGQEDGADASTPCIPQAYKVDSKPSPGEIAAILGTKTSFDSSVAKVSKGRLGELPHKEELPQEAGYMYNYEDFNKDIDDANNALSRLPKKLDGLQLLILNHNIQFIRANQIHFKECLSLEKKQHTLNVLKSTLERFFKEEETQQEPPKPDSDTVTRQELWLYVKRKRSYPALKESIDELKRLIDHETQAKIPLTGTPEEKAMICLEKAGWYEGRNVDLSEVKAFYESGGITLPTGAENFLKEYSGLNDEWTLYEETDSGLQEAGRFIFKLYPLFDSSYDNDRYFDDEDYPAPLQYKVEAFAGNDLVYIGDIGYKYPAQVFLGDTGKIYTQISGFIQCYDSLLDILLYKCSSVCDTRSEEFESAADLILKNFKAADKWEYVAMRR